MSFGESKASEREVFSRIDSAFSQEGVVKVSNQTSAVFARLPSSSPVRLTIDQLRAGFQDWDRAGAFPYPGPLSPASFTEISIGTVPVSLYKAPEATASTLTVIFLHGGGFVGELTEVHKSFMASIIDKFSCHAVLPHYPLAPEYKAPDVISQTTNFLKSLLMTPSDYGLTDNVVVIGYSSGGNLAWNAILNLLASATDQDLVNKISNLVLMSPWADISLETMKNAVDPYRSQQDADKMTQPWVLEQMRDWYLPHGASGKEREYSPIYRMTDELKGLPRTTIVVGGIDRLLNDSIESAKLIKSAGVPLDLLILPGQSHNHSAHVDLRENESFTADIIASILRDPFWPSSS